MDALLASYAAGASSRPMHALIASHLALKADNRQFVSVLENLASGVLDKAETKPVASRDARLNAIFGDNGFAERHAPSSDLVPAPLASYLSTQYDALPWKAVLPGLKEVKIEDRSGLEASMLWIKAGRAMPSHTHPGIEATLVLKGSFSDKTGYYERGDVSVVDSDVDHKPVAGSDEDCICFAVSEGPVKLTGPIARLFQMLSNR
ncbi:MAG: ChrR family anti-sigma-E factor [Beijerinckiaceae bacterium]